MAKPSKFEVHGILGEPLCLECKVKSQYSTCSTDDGPKCPKCEEHIEDPTPSFIRSGCPYCGCTVEGIHSNRLGSTGGIIIEFSCLDLDCGWSDQAEDVLDCGPIAIMERTFGQRSDAGAVLRYFDRALCDRVRELEREAMEEEL